MYGCENWTIKKAEHQGIDAFECVVLEKKLQSPLDCKAIKPVNPKRNPLWKFFGKTNSEAEVPILWPPNVKSWLTGEGPDTSEDWRPEEKGVRWVGGIIDSMDMSLGKLWETVKDREAWNAVVHGVKKSQYNLVIKQQ